MSIKIRNSLTFSENSLHKRIKALWSAGRNTFCHIFTFPQGVQSSSSHRGKNSPRSRISLFILTSLLLNLDAHKLGDFPISALQGTFSSPKLVIIGSSTQKRDERCQIGWRSHQHVASKVVRMMPRLKNRKNLTNTMEPKPTSWKGDDRMDRRRQPTSGVENPRIVQSIVLPKISRKPSLSRETRESDTVH